MSNLVKHAHRELTLIGMGPNDETADPIDRLMGKQILAIVKTFSKQGHSGFSAGYATNVIDRLLRYAPLSDLTGDDDEWNDVSEMSGKPMWQNRRDSRVFKDGDGKAWFIEGRVFRDKNGSTWTNGKSHTPVTFPFRPVTKYVNRRWWKFWL